VVPEDTVVPPRTLWAGVPPKLRRKLSDGDRALILEYAKNYLDYVEIYLNKRGPQKAPTKTLVSLRLSPEVIDHFKAAGPGWQTRIDGALMESIKRRA
jgi:uncharacterized protein (DUF4415 family)